MHLNRFPHRLIHLLLGAVAALTAFAGSVATGEPNPFPPTLRPPIPVRFRLDEPAYVTLVIERTAAVEPDSTGEKPDKDDGKQHYTGRHGLRVKNLVSNTRYPAGEHTVWWDGLDETNTRLVVIPG